MLGRLQKLLSLILLHPFQNFLQDVPSIYLLIGLRCGGWLRLVNEGDGGYDVEVMEARGYGLVERLEKEVNAVRELGDGMEGEGGDNLVYKVLGHSFYLLSVNKNLKYSAKTHPQRTASFFYFHLPLKRLLPLPLPSSSFSIHPLHPISSLSSFYLIKFQF